MDTVAGALLAVDDAGALLTTALLAVDGRLEGGDETNTLEAGIGADALPEAIGSGHASLIITLPEASRAMLGDRTLRVVKIDFMVTEKLLRRRRSV